MRVVEEQPCQGRLEALQRRDTADGNMVITFTIRSPEGVDLSLAAAASLLPWEKYERLPERVAFRPGLTYAITDELDVQLRAVAASGEPGDWLIEVINSPRLPGDHARPSEALGKVPKMLNERGFIGISDMMRFLEILV